MPPLHLTYQVFLDQLFSSSEFDAIRGLEIFILSVFLKFFITERFARLISYPLMPLQRRESSLHQLLPFRSIIIPLFCRNGFPTLPLFLRSS